MKKSLAVFALCAVFSMLMAACGAGEEDPGADPDPGTEASTSLPDAIPSDLPFPEGADVTTTTTQDMSGPFQQIVVGFSFSTEAGAVYERFKQYASDNGYTISTENEDTRRFSATTDTPEGFTLSINDMGSTKIGTVSFIVSTN